MAAIQQIKSLLRFPSMLVCVQVQLDLAVHTLKVQYCFLCFISLINNYIFNNTMVCQFYHSQLFVFQRQYTISDDLFIISESMGSQTLEVVYYIQHY